MKRNIITIDESKCTGCGQCIPGCPEGALQVIDAKARLISDLFCDGLGACIGTCPEGAIHIEEREAQPYDERRTMENIIKGGANVIKAHLRHLHEHGEKKIMQEALAVLVEKKIAIPAADKKAAAPAGCPGMAMHDRRPAKPQPIPATSAGAMPSALQQWPVQLKLLNPAAPFFDDCDLVVAADCVPFSFADFHRRFLAGKILVVFCPKLDQAGEEYIEKLSRIFSEHTIRSITTVHMVVPCCSGVGMIVSQALARCGKQISVQDVTISLEGDVLSPR